MRPVYISEVLVLLILILGFAGCAEDPPTYPGALTPEPCLDKESCGDLPYLDQNEMGPGYAGSVRFRIPARRRTNPRVDPSYLGPELLGASGGEAPASDS